MDSTAARPRCSRAIVLFAALLPVLAAFTPRDLWAPDEPRYGRIAWEMVHGGSWLVSHFNGDFDAEKPPLGYWLMACGSVVSGDVEPASARVPCALLAALAVVVTYRLARRWFRDEALGATSALLFATSALVLWNAPRAALDLPMTAFALLAIGAGTVVVERGSSLAALGCGAALGGGLLVKGPHALYVPILALLGGCAWTGRLGRLRDPRWLLAAATMIVVFAAWLVPAITLGETGYRERLLGQLLSRVSGDNEPHAHGVLFLVPILLLFALPWTPLWVLGARFLRKRAATPEEDRFGLGALLFGVVGPLVLLSIPVSKREVYLVPLLPLLAILGAYALHRGGGRRAVRAMGIAAAPLAVLLAIALVAAPFVAPRWSPPTDANPVAGNTLASGTPRLALFAAAACAVAGAVVAWRARRDAVAATRALGVALGAVWIVLSFGVLPPFDGIKTWDAAVAPIHANARGAKVVAVGFNDAALPWALRPEVVARRADEVRDIDAELDRLFAPGAERVVAAVPTIDWERASAASATLRDRARVIWQRRVGPRVFTVLAPNP